MYSVNETIEAKFLLLHPTTGLPVTGATVVSTLYDETDTIHSYPTVTEIGNGLYTTSFVPDTAGEWTIIFGCSTPVQSGGLTFPVGLGMCKDIEDKVDIVDTNVDSVLADTNELQTDWTNGGRLDLLLDGVKTKTDLIGASVAPSNEYDTEMARITGNVALEATLTAIKGSGWTTETLKAIYDSISGLNDITAASVWSVATRALTDKANFSLSTAGIDAIRTSVCLTGDTANSIGKILYDFYNTRLSSTRCGYIDYLASGTYGLSALKILIDTVDTVVDAIKAKTDLIGASVATAGEYTSALSTIDGYFDVPTADATTDATIRDIVGRKTDTANTTVGTTSSLMRYTKGILGLLTNGTYGLSALETLVDDLETNVAVVDSVVDTIQEDTDKIDVLESLIDSVMDLYRVGGTVTTDGTEQTVYISDSPEGLIKPTHFLIDMTNQTSAEMVTLKFYYRMKYSGSYIPFYSGSLSGSQEPLGKSYDLLPNAWGYKVTIEKTAGTNRAYDWEIFGGE